MQQWLDILGIDKRTADAPFHSLSRGQQRLALIVRALVKHPTLLILDEPLQGLDPLNRQLIRRFVDVLISEGETQLLFVSHHAEDAPACITHRLEFVPDGGLYRYVLTKYIESVVLTLPEAALAPSPANGSTHAGMKPRLFQIKAQSFINPLFYNHLIAHKNG